MSSSNAPVEWGDLKFDLARVMDVFSDNPLLCFGILTFAYLFWISRQNGLLGLLIDYLKTRAELKSKVELGRQSLMRKFGNVRGSSAPQQALPPSSSPTPALSGPDATAASGSALGPNAGVQQ